MKIGIWLPNWIGDVVMATPTLRAMRRRYPNAEIVGVMRPYVVEVLAGLSLLDRTIIHDRKGDSTRLRGWPFVRALRRERFDLALLLPNSIGTALLARLSGARRRVGFSRDGRGWLLTDRVQPKPKSTPHPVIDEYLRLARHLGCRDLSRSMELAVDPADEARIESIRGGLGIGNRYVCLNPGGAFGAAKHWPAEHFGELAARIVRETDRDVLILCGPAERDEARNIAASAQSERVVSLADADISIGLTKAAVKHCELLVTTDSGPRHFAPPFNVPVVTLFGPTHIAWSETFYAKAVHLQIAVDCGPCQQRVCPLSHHRCMRELTVDRVFDAVQEALHKSLRQAS